jgi:hypothetical protein
MAARRLSKSRYVAGLQCHRRLWWETHEHDAPELRPGPALQAIFDQGHLVGELARERFPGGVLVDVPHTRPTEWVAATAKAIASGAGVLYEAAFLADGVFVAVDVLARQRRRPFTLIEVKSTTGVKDVHLSDVAVQVHVMRSAGLDVERAEVMHLNRECRFPDLSNLFRRVDVTAEIAPHLELVPAEARRQLEVLAGPLPDAEPGERCTVPYDCPFFARCNVALPDDHIAHLYRIGTRKRVALEAEGAVRIGDLPADVELSAVQRRQQRAFERRELVVDAGLGAALESLKAPVAYLDFETVNPAIPAWEGCRPYDAVPAQWSVHLELADGTIEHHEWLAEGPGDPRPACARALAPVLLRAKTIVAYNAPFEARAIATLAAASPAARKELGAAVERLVDLLPIVRDHVYHRAFGGSFSLKAVAPALVPNASYDDLDVADGSTAASQLARLLLGDIADDERHALRRQLAAYCARDTEMLVMLAARLRDLARRRRLT